MWSADKFWAGVNVPALQPWFPVQKFDGAQDYSALLLNSFCHGDLCNAIRQLTTQATRLVKIQQDLYENNSAQVVEQNEENKADAGAHVGENLVKGLLYSSSSAKKQAKNTAIQNFMTLRKEGASRAKLEMAFIKIFLPKLSFEATMKMRLPQPYDSNKKQLTLTWDLYLEIVYHSNTDRTSIPFAALLGQDRAEKYYNTRVTKTKHCVYTLNLRFEPGVFGAAHDLTEILGVRRVDEEVQNTVTPDAYMLEALAKTIESAGVMRIPLDSTVVKKGWTYY